VVGVLTLVVTAVGQDPGWPRLHTQQSGKLLIYQPQVDEWKNFQDISGRIAFAMTPTGGKEVIGAVDFEASSDVDMASRMVLFSNLNLTKVHFPSLAPASVPAMEALFRSFVPTTVSISVDRVAACIKKPDSFPSVALNNDPPRIFVSYNPAILLEINGEPVLAGVPQTHLKYVVNTTWPLFLETSKSEYFFLVGQQWLTTKDLQGSWSPTKKLPKDMEKLPGEARWASLKDVIPPPAFNSGNGALSRN